MNNFTSLIYDHLPRPFQTLGINVFELDEWAMRKTKRFSQSLRFLQSTETWSEEKILDYQNEHLRNIVKYAYEHVPFYHELYKKKSIDVGKIRTVQDLEQLPIINKNDVSKNWDRFISTKRERYIIRSTSGTTGHPLTIRISYELDIIDKANSYRRDLWGGYNGRYIARLVGDRPVKDCSKDPLYRKSYVMRRVIFPSYCLSLEKIKTIIADMKKLGVEYLQCYPSTGYFLAKYLESADEFLPLKAVFYSSEPLYQYQRNIMEERFSTKLFGYYSSAEEVVSAVECEQGNYHLTQVDGVLEIVKDGKVVDAGEKGFTVTTTLHNYAMPLIRYELNDYTGVLKDDCRCGRKLSLVYPVETKKEDFVITSDGRLISPSLLTFPFKDQKDIIESQIIQKNADSILLRIVKNDSFQQQNENQLIHSMREIVGTEMTLKIEYVNNIHRTKNQKKRFVINELGENYFERQIL